MTKRVSKYQATGFLPLGEPPARKVATAAAVTIVKGDALHWSAGTVTNGTVALAATFAGIAAADCASGGSCEYYPADADVQYSVPVAANTVLVATTHIGTNCDLSACNNIAVNDDPTEGYAFQIDDIDINAEAIAINTYGYAIGHFRVIGTQTGNS